MQNASIPILEPLNEIQSATTEDLAKAEDSKLLETAAKKGGEGKKKKVEAEPAPIESSADEPSVADEAGELLRLKDLLEPNLPDFHLTLNSTPSVALIISHKTRAAYADAIVKKSKDRNKLFLYAFVSAESKVVIERAITLAGESITDRGVFLNPSGR